MRTAWPDHVAGVAGGMTVCDGRPIETSHLELGD